MARVDDVAAAVVRQVAPVDTWRLQKLVYYCQAWHLVWEGRPLFPDRIEAWANGPVVPALYRRHAGQFEVHTWKAGDHRALLSDEATSVQAVIDKYGSMSGHALSSLTHLEAPWRNARKGLADGERGSSEIKKQAMLEYYGGLV